jgi:hypothetical protein
MGLIGLLAECFSEQVPGFAALTSFSATSTTAMILATVTLDRFRNMARSVSTTSTQMRREMDKAMQATVAMTGTPNMPCPDIEVARMARGATRTLSN